MEANTKINRERGAMSEQKYLMRSYLNFQYIIVFNTHKCVHNGSVQQQGINNSANTLRARYTNNANYLRSLYCTA